MVNRKRGFTLIELMVAIAVAAIILTLAAPSFYDFILTQRLKGVSAQIVTDVQFARAEAAQRNVPVYVRFSNSTSQTCYMLFASPTSNGNACACNRSPLCTTEGTEIRTVTVPLDLNVRIQTTMQSPFFWLDPATGAMGTPSLDVAGLPATQYVVDSCIVNSVSSCFDNPKLIRTEVKLSGRPNLCTPSTSMISGFFACAASPSP